MNSSEAPPSPTITAPSRGSAGWDTPVTTTRSPSGSIVPIGTGIDTVRPASVRASRSAGRGARFAPDGSTVTVTWERASSSGAPSRYA